MPRWEGWNFNRQLLLRLHRHEKTYHLQKYCCFTFWRVRAQSGVWVKMCVFTYGVGLSGRSCACPSLKVGDCVTLSSRLSSEASVCHIWLPSAKAETKSSCKWSSTQTEVQLVICEASLQLQLCLKLSFCPSVQTDRKVGELYVPSPSLSFSLTALWGDSKASRRRFSFSKIIEEIVGFVHSVDYFHDLTAYFHETVIQMLK